MYTFVDVGKEERRARNYERAKVRKKRELERKKSKE